MRARVDLTDVLRSALTRADRRCGPPVDLVEALLRRSDVQQQPQRKPAAPALVPVILGTATPTDLDWDHLTGWIKDLEK